jgi:branched-chain amino acid transport system substrate-binding protein
MNIHSGVAGRVIRVALLLTVILCAVGPAQATEEPIVFALLEPLSGPFKDVGTEVAAFVEYGVEQLNANGGLLGRKIKLIELDNQMKPDISVRMARKAVIENGAKVIMNHTSSSVGLALSKMAVDLNVIHLTLHNETDEITGSQFQPNTFRVCLSTTMHSGILANYFAHSPHKRFYIINQDFAFGHAVAESFKKVFMKVKRGDQEIVGEDFHPLANKDFGPYITKALAAKPDVIITGNFGPDLPGLIKQSRDLGLKAVFGSYFLDNSVYMNQVRDAGIGAVTAEIYMPSLKNVKNQEFVQSWQAWFKKNHPDRPLFHLVPSSVALSVDGLAFMGEAIKKAGSVDAGKVIPAWEGMSFEGIIGKVSMRVCDHQIQAPGYVAVMQKDHAFKDVIDFPFLGEPITIPIEDIAVAGAETGNDRCK